jgi:hypothetical protein
MYLFYETKFIYTREYPIEFYIISAIRNYENTRTCLNVPYLKYPYIMIGLIYLQEFVYETVDHFVNL